jgi:ubiquinone/menaquinone biosynthesis C-methylase UbiE
MNDFIKQDRDRLELFKRYGYDIPKARNLIIAKAGISKGRILEVGTGRGHMAVALARKGLKLISIDLDRKAQQIAKAKLKAMKLDKLVTFKVMNAERLKYKDNSFDYVVSVNFIHHAKNPVKCLKEMARVVKNKLIIADLNKKGERIMEKVHALDGHRHPASKISLKDAKAFLEKMGMRVNVYEDTCQTILVTKKEA